MIRALNGLLGLALVIVVAADLSAARLLPAEFGFGFDQVALMIFVVQAGLVLAWQFGPKPCDRPTIADFVRDRARCVVPAYLVVLVASIAVERWWGGWPYRFDSVAEFARAAFLLDAPGALSIIPAMAQCYALFLVAWWLRSRGAHWMALVALAVAAAMPTLLGWGIGDDPKLSVVAPYFLFGVGLGLTWEPGLETELARRASAVSLAGGVSFLLVVMNLPSVRTAHGWNLSPTTVGSTWLDPLTAVIVLTLVVTVAAQARSLQFLSTMPAQFLGRRAYPLYLAVPVVIAVVA